MQASRPLPSVVKLDLDETEQQKIKTIQEKTGIKGGSNIVRYALTQEYNRLVGSPVPKKR